MSALPLEAGVGRADGGASQGNSQPFAIYSSCAASSTCRILEPTADRIPADITTLMVVHPADFSDAAMYAIDQFVLRGGHAIVFVDPLSEILNQQGPGQIGRGRADNIEPAAAVHRVGHRLRPLEDRGRRRTGPAGAGRRTGGAAGHRLCRLDAHDARELQRERSRHRQSAAAQHRNRGRAQAPHGRDDDIHAAASELLDGGADRLDPDPGHAAAAGPAAPLRADR